MLTKFYSSIDSAAQQQPAEKTSRNRFGKKFYITAAALIAIAIVLTAIFLVPANNAKEFSLNVHYRVGEKLTYQVTSTSYSQIGNSSTNSTAQSTLTIEVLNINGGTYTLNYTTTLGTAGSATSAVLEVKETDMANLFTLLPVVLQQYMENSNSGSPLETADFNQSEAQVGDTWQIPVTCVALGVGDAEMTVKFSGIENLAVQAGNFRVFEVEFKQASIKQSQNQPADEGCGILSGESCLELESCKQIQSTLQLNMTASSGVDSGDSSVATYSSVLIRDENP